MVFLMCPKRGVKWCTKIRAYNDDIWQENYLGKCGLMDEHEKEKKKIHHVCFMEFLSACILEVGWVDNLDASTCGLLTEI